MIQIQRVQKTKFLVLKCYLKRLAPHSFVQKITLRLARNEKIVKKATFSPNLIFC